MRLTRRTFLGRSVAASALVVSAPANADPANPDAELLGLGREFTAAVEAVEASADRAVLRKLCLERCRLIKPVRVIETELDRLVAVADTLALTILRTPARTPAGVMVKIQVEEAWPGTYEDDELMAAIIADLKVMTADTG